MSLNDFDSKIENAFEVCKYYFRVLIEYILVLIICLSVVVISRFFEHIQTNEIAIAVGVLIMIYLAGLMGYKYIFKKRLLKGEMMLEMGKTSFYGIYALYLLASAIVTFGIECLVSLPKTPEAFCTIFVQAGFGIILNVIVENEYRYWGLIFFKKKIFIASVIIVYVCNFILAHYLSYGILIIFFLVCVFPKMLKYTVKPFIPDGFVVSANGDIGFFYKF